MSLKLFKGLGMNVNSDKYLLPEHYIPVQQPFYKGPGEHSVRELEKLCAQFKEYCHQQALIKNTLIKDIKMS